MASKIYHYTRLATAIEHILPKMQLRTNSLNSMNDPKENQPWAFGGVNIDLREIYPQTYSDKTHSEHLFKLGGEIKRSCQMLCFVKNEPYEGFLNEIMWAHYSENHRGICFELDLDVFIQENEEFLNDYVIESITYGEYKRADIVWERTEGKDQNIKRFVKTNYKNLYLRKSKYWEMENEIRLLIFNNEQRYLSIQKSLTGIYFGLVIQNEYRPAIDRFINAEQTKLYNLYYERGKIMKVETEKNDWRKFIIRKYLDEV